MLARYAWWVPQSLSVALMRQAARSLVGEHDFAAFSCRADDEESTRTRVLYAGWERWGRGVMFRIGAVRFLYKMVRAIVAASLLVADGKEDRAALSARLAAPAQRARHIAPARGLHLVGVDYAAEVGEHGSGSHCLPPGPVL